MLYPQNGDRIVAVDFVTGLYLSVGWGVEPPAKISDPPAAIKKRKLSMYLCISTVVDFNRQNFDPPNEI